MTTVSKINGRLQAQSATHGIMSARVRLGIAAMRAIRLRERIS
jgi:hypothetical protein